MTSVEWLIEEMLSKGFFKESVTLTNIDHLQYKAEELHKQEIIKSYRDGRSDQQSEKQGKFYNRISEQYYNETFENANR
jgi:hypothetical protein